MRRLDGAVARFEHLADRRLVVNSGELASQCRGNYHHHFRPDADREPRIIAYRNGNGFSGSEFLGYDDRSRDDHHAGLVVCGADGPANRVGCSRRTTTGGNTRAMGARQGFA